jgi:hypothetical protein
MEGGGDLSTCEDIAYDSALERADDDRIGYHKPAEGDPCGEPIRKVVRRGEVRHICRECGEVHPSEIVDSEEEALPALVKED